MVIVMVVCQPPLHNHRRNQVQMKLDTNSLAHTKWECKYHIVLPIVISITQGFTSILKAKS